MSKIQHDFTKYESYRHELADLARMFFEQAKSFPGIHFEFVQADGALRRDRWASLIASHRFTTDEDRESWDIYPTDWTTKKEIERLQFKQDEAWASNMCGHYFTEMGHLKAARIELEELAGSGMTVLDAIARESESHKTVREVVSLKGRAGYGYWGFLDGIRNTAERYRCASLNVLPGILGVERDLRAELAYIGRQLAEGASDRTALPDGAITARIVPDIFTACGNALTIWLEARPPIPSEPHVVYPDIPVIALPALQPDIMAASGKEPEVVASTLVHQEKKPHWNEDTRELLYDGSVVKRFKQPAENQVAVLAAFEEANWPRQMDDPIPPKDDMESKRRLGDTVEALNDNHVTEEKMHFRADGTGEGIRWVDGPKPKEQRAKKLKA